MYFNQLKSNRDALMTFYSMARLLALSENLKDVNFDAQSNTFSKEIAYQHIMTDKEYFRLSELMYEVNNSFTEDSSLKTAIYNVNQILQSSINSVLDNYKDNTSFVNEKVLEAIQKNKINALSFDKRKVKEFLLSLPELKDKIMNEVVQNLKVIQNLDLIEKIHDLKALNSKQKKIFLFNLLRIFSQRNSLSSYSEEILEFLCKKMNLEIDYIDEIFDAAKKISAAFDYANELISE